MKNKYLEGLSNDEQFLIRKEEAFRKQKIKITQLESDLANERNYKETIGKHTMLISNAAFKFAEDKGLTSEWIEFIQTYDGGLREVYNLINDEAMKYAFKFVTDNE